MELKKTAKELGSAGSETNHTDSGALGTRC